MVNAAKASLFFQLLLFSCATTPIVRLSVPEGHYIILICSGHTHRNSTSLEWRGTDGNVIAVKKGHSATTMRDHKYSLLSDGSLLIKSLHRTDSGEYRCREQIVADVEVLTGQDYNVTAGRTILLPCKVTDKQRQKWVLKKNKERKPIYTRHKNGTLRKEIEDPQNRFSHMEDNTLQIANLQPEDRGEYWCNGRRAASLTVRTVEKNDYTNHVTTEDTDTETDESENEGSDQVGVLIAVAIGVGVLVLLAGFLSLWLLTRKKDRKGNKQETTGLQPQRPPDVVTSEAPGRGEAPSGRRVEDGEIHYASLGRHNWRERSRVQGERQHVIYSTLAGGEG